MVGRACWHRSAYRQAETLQARAGYQDVRAFSLLNIARTQLQLDQVAAAHASYRAAERVFAELDAGQLGVGTRAFTHGLILLAQAQPAAAAERLQTACARFEATQSLPLLAQCLDALARAQTALGRITQALAAREAQLRVTATIDRNMQREQALLLTGEFQSSQRELDNLRLQRETERQQRQLQEAARHERVRAGLLALMALVLVGILLYQRRTHRRLRSARRDAATDSLTGAASRRHAMDVLQRFMSQWHAQARVFSVLVFDADRFKTINDSHGHAAGDRVLQRVATAARTILRDSDVLARIGGEESWSSCRAPSWSRPRRWRSVCAPRSRRCRWTTSPAAWVRPSASAWPRPRRRTAGRRRCWRVPMRRSIRPRPKAGTGS